MTSSPGGKTCTASDADTLACIVTGLTNGTAYTFTVTATNGEGTSAASVASGSIIPASAPATPIAPVATSGNGRVSVTWTKPADNGSAVTGYTVTSSPGGKTCTASDADTLACIVTGLTTGTAYTFTVTATNGEGTSAASVASSSIIPASAPTPTPVPTLPLYGLFLLGGLMGLFGLRQLRA